MRARTVVPSLLCLMFLVGPPPSSARAQPAPDAIDEAKLQARAAADRGQELYDAARYDEAISAFLEADQAFHAPTIMLMVARAHERRGRLLEARSYYQRVIDEKLTHYAPRVFFEAQADAKKEVEALLPRIPILVVTVTGADDALLIVDGQVTVPNKELELDPGEHRVTASAPGRQSVTRTLMLHEGKSTRLTVALTQPRVPLLTQTTPVLVPKKIPQQKVDTQPRSYLIPAIGLFGLAGAALGVGTLTGVMSLSKTGTLSDECRAKRCYDDAGGATYDQAKMLGNISTVTFFVSGAAAGTGVALLLWTREGSAPSRAAFRVMPQWIEVEGRF